MFPFEDRLDSTTIVYAKRSTYSAFLHWRHKVETRWWRGTSDEAIHHCTNGVPWLLEDDEGGIAQRYGAAWLHTLHVVYLLS